jgi:hypothetical protein
VQPVAPGQEGAEEFVGSHNAGDSFPRRRVIIQAAGAAGLLAVEDLEGPPEQQLVRAQIGVGHGLIGPLDVLLNHV